MKKITFLRTILLGGLSTGAWMGGCAIDPIESAQPDTGQLAFDLQDLQVAPGATGSSLRYVGGIVQKVDDGRTLGGVREVTDRSQLESFHPAAASQNLHRENPHRDREATSELQTSPVSNKRHERATRRAASAPEVSAEE
jgi:hypothetical protein